MSYIAGVDRTPPGLVPETLDDSVAADNPVRVTDACVARLHLGTLGFARATPPPGSPGMAGFGDRQAGTCPLGPRARLPGRFAASVGGGTLGGRVSDRHHARPS